MALPYKRSEVKERARAEWKGACNVTLPSFSRDLARLNPAGIRHDVQLAAKMGFWGTLVASESGTTLEEYMELMRIAAEAAPRGFKLVMHASFSTAEESVRAAKRAEELGFEAALLSYPVTFRPRSARDLVDHTRQFTESTDLAVILFAVPTWGYRPLHPSHFPPEALEEMARLDTAAAVKYEASPPGMIAGLADALRRCGKHVLIESPMEQYAPGLVEWFGMQWIGTSAYESFGDRVPRWFKLLHEAKANPAKWNEAMELYWSYQPARDAKGAFHATFAGANLIHRVGWKYMGWLHGMNGGLLRMPQMRLNPGQMAQLRAGMQKSGYEIPADDEGFFDGRHPL
jgi:dihydrodipicolinate synthase/N-acetylneuraminate lyase